MFNLVQMAIQRRIQHPTYADSSKDAGKLVVPQYLSAMKGQVDRNQIIQNHQSRFLKKKEDGKDDEILFQSKELAINKRKGEKQQGPKKKKEKF